MNLTGNSLAKRLLTRSTGRADRSSKLYVLEGHKVC